MLTRRFSNAGGVENLMGVALALIVASVAKGKGAAPEGVSEGGPKLVRG
jgi:hypothetical protein